MIDVWLKIKNRGDLNFVLKHLNFWIATFSNRDKYRIYIYNEDVSDLPFEYNAFPILNRHQILSNNLNCVDIRNVIEGSRWSHRWKLTAFALAAPYFYLNNSSEYVINIDADDIIMPGPTEYYINKAINVLNDNNLSTISYDYIFSYNRFDGHRNILPNHWTFGVNVSKTSQMKDILNHIIRNSPHYAKYIRNLNIGAEANLDIFMSIFLANDKGDAKYNSFITKEGFFHRGFPNFDLYYSKCRDGRFYSNFRGDENFCSLHHKTIFIP